MANYGDWRDALMFNPVGVHSDGTDVSSAVELSPPALATKIMMQSLTQNIRFTLSAGTTPTTTRGFQLLAGDPAVIIPLGPSTVVKVVEEAATADFQYQWGY